MQLLPLVDERNRRSSRTLSTRHGESVSTASNAKFNPCQDFTNTVHRCKSFLKELRRDDERYSIRPSSHSSERRVSSLTDAHANGQPASLTAEKRKTSDAAREEEPRRKDTSGVQGHVREVANDENTEDVEQVHRRSDADASSDAVAVANNDLAFPRELLQGLLTDEPATRKARASRETLYAVRRRLQSLHNVLRMYENTSQPSERRKPPDQTSVIGAIDALASKIEELEGEKVHASPGSGLRRASPRTRRPIAASCDYFKFDRADESSSSVAECSSNMSAKTYQYSSDVTLRNIRFKEYSQLNAQRAACASDLAALAGGWKRLPPVYSAISRESRNPEEQGERDVRERDMKSRSQGGANATRASVSFDLAEQNAAAMSEKTECASSSEDVEVKKCGAPSTRATATEKISDTLDRERYQESSLVVSRSSSRSKISLRSGRESQSTALLLREALLFKRALLTRVESEKRSLTRGTEKDNVAKEPPAGYGAQVASKDNLPAMLVNIETERPVVDAVHRKFDRRYVRLEMKQRKDLRDASVLARRDDEGDDEFARETPSEYFSICDLALADDEQVESSATLSLEPPIYEKVISIVIPVDMERQDPLEDGDDAVGKRLPVMLELEGLILDRLRNIRNYMDVFLHSQNRAIFKALKALQGPIEGDSSTRCPDEAHKFKNSEDGVLKGRRRVSTPSEPLANIECSSTTFVDPNSVADQSKRDYSAYREARESDGVTCDPGKWSLSSSPPMRNETLNALNLREPEVNAANSPPRMKQRSEARRSQRASSRGKAKSDVSLIAGSSKKLNISLRPKRSHSSLTQRDTLERIRRILRQSDAKSRDGEDECTKSESESQSATPSRSVLLSQGLSARSCIPILRNRLEAARMRQQTSARSPTRSPLTMLWRENVCARRYAADEEAARGRSSMPIDEGSGTEEVAFSLTKASTAKNREEVVEENSAATHRDGNITATNSTRIFSDGLRSEAPGTDKGRADKHKRFTCDGRSDMMITERLGNTAPKTLTIISITTSDDSRESRPASSFILRTKNAGSATNSPELKAEPQAAAVEKMEKEVTAKPSITDTCTSMSDLR
ncbi:uncharacterized protein LOC109504219 [Harpegnathos saltator]|uniref:uncharacterized protein LOC109504219 n=1 Tax=Harpegnathos saltator TaxID=610380 RepID=UPI000948BC1E|nr:uncharacterized protein LOC109504219 [Harpegnathos saltator]